MSLVERANELAAQLTGFATVSITDVIGSLFMKLVMFFVNLLLGM